MICYLALIVLFPTPAFAYLDPGTGSIIAQVVIAAMLGVSFQARRIWSRLKQFLPGHKNKENSKDKAKS